MNERPVDASRHILHALPVSFQLPCFAQADDFKIFLPGFQTQFYTCVGFLSLVLLRSINNDQEFMSLVHTCDVVARMAALDRCGLRPKP